MDETGRYGDSQGGIFKDKVEQGRYGPIFPKSPACYGFSIIAKIMPGREEVSTGTWEDHRRSGRRPARCLAVLKLHYLRWVLFHIKGDTYFHVSGHLRHRLRQIHRGCRGAFLEATGINTVFENLEGFPKDWKTNPAAFIKFVREHQCPSFLEYGEYPYVSADEIKKALKLKAAFSNMLDQMQ